MKILHLENIHPDAGSAFRKEGWKVKTLSHSLEPEDLERIVEDVCVLGIRSKTRITAEVLRRASRLVAIGAYCIGTEQIDVDACNERGVVVFNAPYSNTRSVVELALAEMILLLRGVYDSSIRLHGGTWNKSSAGFHEIRGKRLGIVGYGNIGSQLSVLAEAMGMEVCYYDIEEKLTLGNAKKCSLEELLRTSDIVTVHIDGRDSNRDFIGDSEFGAMKPGVIFLNLSRGFVVDMQALASGLASGKIRGAAVDVYPEEPLDNNGAFSCPLQGMPNVILTPHIGGSTEEAQHNIAAFVAARIVDYFKNGSTSTSVNFPNIQPSGTRYLHRFAHIHRNIPGMLAKINDLFARNGVNIAGQNLQTRGSIGYAVIDINSSVGPEIVEALGKIQHTISSRVVF